MFFIFYVVCGDKPVSGFMERDGADSLYKMLCKISRGKVRVAMYARSCPEDEPLLLISNM